MSVRVYTGRHSDRGRPHNRWQQILPWATLATAIVASMVAAFTDAGVQGAAIAAGLVLGAVSIVSHAILARGWAYASGYLAMTLLIGLAVEILAVQRQFPFGDLAFATTLGPAVLGVPIAVPLAWVLLAYPVLLAVQRLAHERLTTAMLGAVALASIDLLWDPVATSGGQVTWAAGGWPLPGLDPLPLQNLLGWLLVGFVLTLGLDRLPRKVAKDGVPTLALSWLFAWGLVANIVTMQSWAAVAWGGLGLAAIVLPWWWRVWSEPQW